MCMAVALFGQPGQDALYAAVGYEDGTLAVWDTAHPDQALMSTRLHKEVIMTVAVDAQATGTLSRHPPCVILWSGSELALWYTL